MPKTIPKFGDPPGPHELKAITIIYARCACGWEYRVSKSLKGYSDEDLCIEVGTAWENHRKENEI